MSTRSASLRRRPRLTSLSHGGGCGCKISPGVLAELLRGSAPGAHYDDLLVGTETSDDAAVYRLNDGQAIVSTTDFFMPIVDDPFDFGRIAATNALSDIYAMGARPLLALAIVGMPINTLSHDAIRDILRGGEAVCAQAGIPIAGGHSIDSVEPIYGLAVTGVVDPKKVKRNSQARAGDLLVLGKPLGVGIFSAAFKQEKLDEAAYRVMIDTTTQLNVPGMELANLAGVHAMTDVTGFGLLGHLLEVCRGSGLGAQIERAEDTLAAGCSGAREIRNRDRRVEPKLAVLWQRRAHARAHARRPAGDSDRSADLRWTAGRVRRGRVGRGARDFRAPRLRVRVRHRPNDGGQA